MKMYLASNESRLAYCPYGSCKVVHDDNGVHLISYSTHVCGIDSDGWLYCYGTFSRTTIKHIGAFMKEYAPVSPNGFKFNYYTAKDCYVNNYEYNLYTGEIRRV